MRGIGLRADDPDTPRLRRGNNLLGQADDVDETQGSEESCETFIINRVALRIRRPSRSSAMTRASARGLGRQTRVPLVPRARVTSREGEEKEKSEDYRRDKSTKKKCVLRNMDYDDSNPPPSLLRPRVVGLRSKYYVRLRMIITVYNPPPPSLFSFPSGVPHIFRV